MFYKFNSLRGRLIPSSQGTSVNPQGLKALKIKESPITFESQAVNPARSAAVLEEAALAYSGPQLGRVPVNPRYKSVMALQELFLKNDGLLVWQKRGMRDRVPFAVSIAACVIGGMFAAHALYVMAFPQKSETFVTTTAYIVHSLPVISEGRDENWRKCQDFSLHISNDDSGTDFEKTIFYDTEQKVRCLGREASIKDGEGCQRFNWSNLPVV